MKKKKKDDHENHERWLVSYADFITLLFAFFVVMYSISSVNEGKYRVLSKTMVEAFNHNPNGLNLNDPLDRVNSDALNDNTQSTKTEEGYTVQDEKLRVIANDIRKVMSSLLEKKQVRVTQTGSGVKIDINAGVLFEPGQAVLEKNAVDTLKAVAKHLMFISNKILVEGHTDSAPINTSAFPSNWELSSARASSVVRLFIESGVNSGRLTVLGYADQKPVDTNETESGRSRNRRVTVNIESDVKG